MNNYVLLTYICLLLGISVNAQIPAIPRSKNVQDMSIVDSVNVRVWYALNAIKISETKTYDDLQRLDIGTRLSKYYSFFVFNSDSLVTEWRKQHRDAKSVPSQLGIQGKTSNYWSEYRYSEFFKFFSSNTLTEYSRMPGYLERANCRYTEDIPNQNWNICKDTITVIGYCCQKATCTFRGREYTAWFAVDIPIDNGPWKFGGLPGLILKVTDKNSLFVFECIGIEFVKKNLPIRVYNDYNRYDKKSRIDVLKFQKRVNENFMQVAGLTLKSGKLPSRQPHHYMELE